MGKVGPNVRPKQIAFAALVIAVGALAWRTRAFHERERHTCEPFRGASTPLGDVRHDDTALDRVLADWSARTGVTLTADWSQLSAAGVDPQTPVRLQLSGVKLATALRALAVTLGRKDERLDWDWDDAGVVTLTTARAIDVSPRLVVRAYPAPDVTPLLREEPSKFGVQSAAGEAEEVVRGWVEADGDPNSWWQSGGRSAAVVSMGHVFVLQTRANQWLSAKSLRQLSDLSAAPPRPARAFGAATDALEPSP